MSKITKESYKKAHKPYDVVTIKNHTGVALITEVGCNECQDEFDDQIQYSVMWLVKGVHSEGEPYSSKNAWYNHDELKVHSNIFMVIAKASCCESDNEVKKVMGNLNRGK
jgi:hypothetical protein